VGYRLADLAELVGGRVDGDPERAVEAIRSLESAGPGDLSFLKDPRYRGQAVASGVYFYRLEGSADAPRKMVLLK